MPLVPIIMPQLGESIAEATVVSIAVKIGDEVQADQDVMEVETNKAVMGVTSPCPGKVKEILVELQQSYQVGAVLGYLDVTVEDAARFGFDTPAPESKTVEANGETAAHQPATSTAKKGVQPTVGGLPVPAHAAGASYLSPRMKARMHELGLHAADLSGVAGSGAAGRVTIEDFEKFISHLEKQK
ncbi:MAG TPA: biotin/lipoyl-containing protein, partial [Chthoniobacteraceae bacterium]|nr:biotin/lipoyl-containing protein [Chthoniobacteraceae bacterium]